MIEQWLEINFPKVMESPGTSELRVDCPFCDARIGRPDTKQHMYVNAQTYLVHCFRCSWSGSHVSLIMNMTGCSYGEALIAIEHPKPNVGLFGKLWSPRGLQQVQLDKPPHYLPLEEWTRQDGLERNAAMRYLKQRKVPMELIRRSFGTCRGTNRVWILVDQHYWQGRHLIKGVEPKYVNPTWGKGDALWNWQMLGIVQDLTICEGIFSAIAVSPQALALLGKSATPEQVLRIVKARPKSLTLMLDKGAEAEALHLAEQFVQAGFLGKINLHWLLNPQPDDGLEGLTEEWTFETQVKRGFKPVAV